MNVAKPSFSQASAQRRVVSRSPYHWCASSCAINPSELAWGSDQAGCSIATSFCDVAVTFSIPPYWNSGMTIWSYLDHGYGTPVLRENTSTACGVLANPRQAASTESGYVQ